MITNRYKKDIIISFALILTLVMCFVFSVNVVAEKSVSFGDYEVNYVAYNSNFLSEDAARIYGIVRSKKRGVTVVNVQHKDAPGVGVEAHVHGGASNLMQQIIKLGFDEVREGKAIYYVSTFIFNHEENLTFKLDITIEPTGETHALKWQQKFWRE